MKKHLFYITFLLAALQVNAQIFNAAACNCVLEPARFADTAYTNKLPEPFERLIESFVYNSKRNEVAIGIINSFRAAKNQSELSKAVAETLGQINQKPKEATWFEALKKDMTAVASPTTPVTNWKPYTYQMSCLFAERMHAYYTKFPEQALPAHRELYEPVVPMVPVADSTQTADASPAAASAEGSSGMLFWVMVVLALGGWAFGLMQRSQIGALQQKVDDAQANAKQGMEGEMKSLRSQIAQSEQKSELAHAEAAEWKRKYVLLEQELEYLKNKQTQIMGAQQKDVTEAVNAAVRYLYAPTSDGIFYRNSIREQADGDTLYRLSLKDAAAQEAEFSIILNEEVLRRADSMAQQLLMPACDLMGKGKMPLLLQANNIRNGRLRREGEGWRIVEKIKITW